MTKRKVSDPETTTKKTPYIIVVLVMLLFPLCSFASSFICETGPGFAKAQLDKLPRITMSNGREGVLIDDILLDVQRISEKSAFRGTKWPYGMVFYDFESTVTATNRQRWQEAAAEWSAIADVCFLPRTTQDNYIYVRNSAFSYSYSCVGMVGVGAQDLGIYDWGVKFTICHEIGHSLGLDHEHSRSDRDSYVTIVFVNIEPDSLNNFKKSSTTNYGTYDFDSVMHYPSNAFSSNGENTIVPLAAYSQYLHSMGQRTHLSVLDKSGMASHYHGSPHWHPNGTLLNHRGASYFLQNGLLRHIPSTETYWNWFDWSGTWGPNHEIAISDAEFNISNIGWNMGPRALEERLWKTPESGAVWLIQRDYCPGIPLGGDNPPATEPEPTRWQRRGIVHSDIFNGVNLAGARVGHRYDWSAVETVSRAKLESITRQGPMIRTPYPDGSLLRTSANPAVYVLSDGLKRLIFNRAAFDAAGYSVSNVVVISDAEMNRIEGSSEPAITEDMILYGSYPSVTPGFGPSVTLTSQLHGEAINPHANTATTFNVNGISNNSQLEVSVDGGNTVCLRVYVSEKCEVSKGSFSVPWTVPDVNSSNCQVRVIAYGNQGTQGYDVSPIPFTITGSGSPGTAPAAPTGVSASDGTYSDKVRITWNASPGATSYQVWKSVSPDTGSAVWIDSPTSTSYDDSALQGNVTYYYRIKASNGTLTSDLSSYDSGYRYQPLPNVPGNPSPPNGATNIPRSGQVLSWTGGGGVGNVQYALRIEKNPNPGFYAGFGSISGTSWQIPFELKAGEVYYWGIRSKDDAGQIVDSPIWRFASSYAYSDLIPTSLSISAGTVEPDAQVTISFTVKNQGTYLDHGGSYARFYLSRNAGAKEQPLFPVSVSIPELLPGQEKTVTCATTLAHLQVGQSYIDGWIDSGEPGPSKEANSDNNLRSLPITYTDTKPPVFTFVRLQTQYPKTGHDANIIYVVKDDVAIVSLGFFYSTDDGANWIPIEEGYVPTGSAESGAMFPWSVPQAVPLSDTFRVRVVAEDSSENSSEGVSQAYTLKDGVAPVIQIVSPNGGEIWDMGSTHDISWTVSAPNGVGTMALNFCHDGHTKHLAYVSSNTTGVYSWTLPEYLATTTAKILIRLEDLNMNQAEDYSDNTFIIQDNSAPPLAPWNNPDVVTSVPADILDSKDNISPRIAVDSVGDVHLVYKYMTDDMDSSGTPIERWLSETIMYKKLSGGVWSSPAPIYSLAFHTHGDPNPYRPMDLRIAVDSQNLPHVVWANKYAQLSLWNKDDIFYSNYDGASWSSPEIISDAIRGFFSTKTFSWSGAITLSQGFEGAACAVVNGKIYLIGGQYFMRTYEYDPETESLLRKSDIPGSGIHAGGAAVIGNVIYAIGTDSSIKIYDPDSDSWSVGPNIPTAREYPGVAAYNGKIYVLGSMASPGSSKVEIYDPNANSWSTGANMPTPRGQAAVGVVGNQIFVLGGRASGGNPLDAVEAYDPSANAWNTKVKPSAIYWPRPAGAAAQVLEEKIYTFGGEGNRLWAVNEYDPATNCWTPMTSMANEREFASAGTVNGKVYVIGGQYALTLVEAATVTSELTGARSGFPDVWIDSSDSLHIIWADGGFMVPDQSEPIFGFSYGGVTTLYSRVRQSQGQWSTASQLLAGSGYYPSLDGDPTDLLHVTFEAGGLPYYTNGNGSTWSEPLVIGAKAQQCLGVSVDTVGHPHMVWNALSAALGTHIRYSHFDGSSWFMDEVVSGAQQGEFNYPTICTDSTNRAHVVFEQGEAPYRVLYTRRDSTCWTPPVQLHFDSQMVSQGSSHAAISSSDEMHVVWSAPHNGHSEIHYNHGNVGSTTDIYAPVVTVESPSKDSTVSIGSSVPVRWSARDGAGVTGVDIDYTTDAAVTWEFITSGEANDGEYEWTVPDVGVGISLQIRITAYDAAGNAGYGLSETFGSDDLDAPNVEITAPLGGSTLAGLSTADISWVATDNLGISGIDVEYMFNGDSNWERLGQDLANTGALNWDVPNVNEDVTFRVTAHDNAGHVTSATTSPAIIITRTNTPPAIPHSPQPLADAAGVPVDPLMLQWQSEDVDGDVLNYELRFGTEPNPPVVHTLSTNSFQTSSLGYQTTYYWQVAVSDGHTSVSGPVWAFTTQSVGTVSVDVTPDTASWTLVDGNGVSHSGTGDTTLSNLPTGDIQVMWEPLAGFTEPSPNPSLLVLEAGGNQSFTGIYERNNGSVAVTVTPETADWTILDSEGGAHSASGNGTASNIPTGPITFCWGTLDGYDGPAPNPKMYSLGRNDTLSISGQYERTFGTVTVDVTPNSASWSFTDGDGLLHSGSGNATVADIPTGEISITWDDLSGYDVPNPNPMVLSLFKGETVTFSSAYTRQIGNVQVQVMPEIAFWDLTDGDGVHREVQGNTTVLGVATGMITLGWKDLTNYDKPDDPGPQTLEKDATISFSGIYARHTGTVVVDVTPNIASWSFTDADGNIHVGSGSNEIANIPTGSIAFTWEMLDGYMTPASPATQDLSLGGIVTFSITYTPIGAEGEGEGLVEGEGMVEGEGQPEGNAEGEGQSVSLCDYFPFAAGNSWMNHTMSVTDAMLVNGCHVWETLTSGLGVTVSWLVLYDGYFYATKNEALLSGLPGSIASMQQYLPETIAVGDPVSPPYPEDLPALHAEIGPLSDFVPGQAMNLAGGTIDVSLEIVGQSPELDVIVFVDELGRVAWILGKGLGPVYICGLAFTYELVSEVCVYGTSSEGEGSIEGVVEGLVEGEGEGVVEGEPEGVVEGQPEGTTDGEGLPEGVEEGEGVAEGEGQDEGAEPGSHTADQNGDGVVNLTELLRVIQFFNIRGFHCVTPPLTSEDGYLPGAGGDQSCAPHASDYNPQDWQINLTELLRLIQFFNMRGYHACPDQGTEDGFCPGP